MVMAVLNVRKTMRRDELARANTSAWDRAARRPSTRGPTDANVELRPFPQERPPSRTFSQVFQDISETITGRHHVHHLHRSSSRESMETKDDHDKKHLHVWKNFPNMASHALPSLTELARTACLHESLGDEMTKPYDVKSKQQTNTRLRTAILQWSSLRQKINGLYDADEMIRTHRNSSAMLWSHCAANEPLHATVEGAPSSATDKHGSNAVATVHHHTAAEPDESKERHLPDGSYKIHPDDKRKIAWDLVIGLMIVYSTIMVPFRISFDAPPNHIASVFDWIFDTCFVIDMALSFMTAFEDADGELIDDTRRIFMHYLKTSFFIDFFSTVPWDKIPLPIQNESMLRMSKLLRVLRMAKLLRVFRLLKMGSNMGDGDFSINPSLVSLMRMLVCLVFIGHLLACGWHAIFVYNDPYSNDGPPNWVAQSGLFSTSPQHGFADDDSTSINYDSDGRPRYVDVSLRYAAAIYWAFTTMTTVGYGDINTSNTSERLYAVFAMLVGATVFGYVIGNVTVMMENIDMKSALFREKMDRIKEYLRDRKFPSIMAKRLRRHFKYYNTHVSVFDPQDYLNTLPQAAVCHVVYRQYFSIISQCSFFKDNSPPFVTQVVDKCKPFFLEAGEFLCFEGEIGTHLFLMPRGLLKLYTCNVHTNVNTCFTAIGADSCVGEAALMRLGCHQYTALSIRHSECVSLAKEDLGFLLDAFPEVKDWLDKAEAPTNYMAFWCKTDRDGNFASPKSLDEVQTHEGAQSSAALAVVQSRLFAELSPKHQASHGDTATSASEGLPKTSEGLPNAAKPLDAEEGRTLSELESAGSSISFAVETKEPERLGLATSVSTIASVSTSPSSDRARSLIHGESQREVMLGVEEDEQPLSNSKRKLIPLPAIGAEAPPSKPTPPGSPPRFLEDMGPKADTSAGPPPSRFAEDLSSAAMLEGASLLEPLPASPVSPCPSPSVSSTGAQSLDLPSPTSARSARQRHTNDLIEQELKEAERTIPRRRHSRLFESRDNELTAELDRVTRSSTHREDEEEDEEAHRRSSRARRRSTVRASLRHRSVEDALDEQTSEPGEEGRRVQLELLREQKIIHPEYHWKMVWDLFVCLLIIYSVITVTYYIGFEKTISEPDKFDTVTAHFDNYFVNTIFLLDMIVTCRTAFFDIEDESILVTDPKIIVHRYLTTWFVLDLLSTFPFFVFDSAGGPGFLKLFKGVRAVRLVRLAKISRLMKLSDSFEKWEDSIPAVNPSFLRLMKLFTMMIFVAHLNACFWYYFGVNLDDVEDGERVGRNWVDNYCIADARLDDDVCLSELDSWAQYVASVYWAFTTMTTVGYGDIGPNLKSKGEIIVTILSQVVGTTLFAYVIGTLVTLVLNLDPGARQRKIQVEFLNNFMRDIHLTKFRRRQMRRHFNYRIRLKSVFQEDSILDQLPPALKNPALIFLNRSVLPRLPFVCDLERKHHGFIGLVLPRLKPASFMKGDMVNGTGLNAREMYFVMFGTVDARRLNAEYKVDSSAHRLRRRTSSQDWVDTISHEISARDFAKETKDRPGMMRAPDLRAMVSTSTRAIKAPTKTIIKAGKAGQQAGARAVKTAVAAGKSVRKSSAKAVAKLAPQHSGDTTYDHGAMNSDHYTRRTYTEGSQFCELCVLLPEDAQFDLRDKYIATSVLCHMLVLQRSDLQAIKLLFRDVFTSVEEVLQPKSTKEAQELIFMDGDAYEEAMTEEDAADEAATPQPGQPAKKTTGPKRAKKKKKRGLKGR